MIQSRRPVESWNANPVLLAAGAISIVVAVVGLFVRASPTLSGAFLLVGAALLVLSVFEPPMHRTEKTPPAPEIDLALLERTTSAAESEIARGELYSLDDVSGRDETATAGVSAFVTKTTAKLLRRSDEPTAVALTQELRALPTLEQSSRMAPIEGVAAGYRSLTLPSGYMAVYRRLTPVEIKNATGAYRDEDAYLVADLVPLVHSHETSPR